eukprot:2524866-Prymnesium_polylepis.1
MRSRRPTDTCESRQRRVTTAHAPPRRPHHARTDLAASSRVGRGSRGTTHALAPPRSLLWACTSSGRTLHSSTAAGERRGRQSGQSATVQMAASL